MKNVFYTALVIFSASCAIKDPEIDKLNQLSDSTQAAFEENMARINRLEKLLGAGMDSTQAVKYLDSLDKAI